MREWILIALAAVIAAEGAFLVADKLATPRWSYAIIAPSDTNFQMELAKAGLNGWEVVSARRAVTKEVPAYELIMKRPGGSGERSAVVPFLPKASLDAK